MYGYYKYGTMAFGGVDSETGTDLENKVDLMAYLPEYWQGILEMKELQDCLGQEVGTAGNEVDDLLKQYFVLTATWGLEYWEKELGITADATQSYLRRREVLLAKLRGAGATTKAMIKSVAAAFSGGDVEVTEYPRESRFEVKFIGVMGVPPNMPGLMTSLEEIKPAHLTYSFSYTYTLWDGLNEDSLTWDSVKAYTWDGIKAYS